MESSIFKKAGEFLAEKSKRRYWQAAVAALGVIVIVSTAYMLSKPAHTLVKETYCGMEEHEHTDECYEMVLVCELEEDAESGVEESPEATEAPAPTETPAPAETPAPEKVYIEERILTCGQTVDHKHTLDCCAGVHELICGLEESGEHAHAESCYLVVEPVTALVCGQEESEAHRHGDDCYVVVGAKKLTCTEAESENHTHGDDCYTMLEEDDLICGTGETVVHHHTAECYAAGQQQAELICGLDETEGHSHGDECYVTSQKQELICQEEEAQGHTHTDECYTVTEQRELTCETEENEEHQHTDDCYTITSVKELTCEIEESEGHQHTDECYNNIEEKELICEIEEAEAHIHSEECYKAAEGETTLICGLEEGAEITPAEHVHTLACSTVVQREVVIETASEPEETEEPEATPEPEATEEPDATPEPEETEEPASEEAEKHVHTEECYERVLVCKAEEHKHEDICYERTFCGIQAHTHHAACYDEEGVLTCEEEEHVHAENCYKEPHCGFSVHVHRDECSDEEGNLICGLEEHIHEDGCYFEVPTYYCLDRIHKHGEDCRDEEGNIICAYADFVVHTHNEVCYDPNGRLICLLPEREEHVHTEECYAEAAEGEEPELICGKTEIVLHEHTEDCLGEEGGLVCGRMEVLNHEHSEDCYVEKEIGKEEIKVEEVKLVYYCADRIHTHKDACQDENGKLVCGYADFVIHTHNEECYDRNMKLVCPLPETEEHVHSADCIGAGSELVCGKTQLEAHEHTEECFDEDKNLVCGKTEVLRHEHGDECHVEKPVIIEAEEINYYCMDRMHAHTEECLDEEGNLVCGIADFVVHTHDEECYDINEMLTCPLPEIDVELHTHTDECLDEEKNLVCGKLEVLEHKHNEECYIELSEEIIKTFECDSFVVTAIYSWRAYIPQNAELIVEEITAESDEEHYAEREAQYQEIMGNSKATIHALLKIGFYVDDEEVEPEAPVAITVQFLDENGLEDGSPITVVHFGKDGTEVLDGSDTEDGKTTFELESFSDVLIGYGKVGDVVTVPVNEIIEYSTDAFNIKFHVEGEVTVPVSEIKKQNAGNGEDSEMFPQEGEEGQPGAEEAEDEAELVAPLEAEKLEGRLEFRVDALGEDTEEYAALVAYGEEVGDAGEEMLLQIFSVSVTYEGVELDLSECQITAEVMPTREFVDAVNQMSAISTLDGEPIPEDIQSEIGDMSAVTFSVLNLGTEAEDGIGGLVVDGISGMSIEGKQAYENYTPVSASLAKTFAVRASGQPNPNFTVQYYANLESVKNEERKGSDNPGNALAIINTSGGKLPSNSAKGKADANTGTTSSPNGNKLWNVFVSESGQLEMVKELTRVYSPRNFEYHKAPTIKYINGLIDNPNYILKEIWFYKDDTNCEDGNDCKGIDCINDIHWLTYKYSLQCTVEEEDHIHKSSCYDYSLHFTNRWPKDGNGVERLNEASKIGDEYNNGNGEIFTKTDVGYDVVENGIKRSYAVIKDGATIRLVYDPSTAKPDFHASFYDYDISDGCVYRVQSMTSNDAYIRSNEVFNSNGTLNQSNVNWVNGGSGHFYIRTDQKGINSSSNYEQSGSKLAFGNVNTGTGLGRVLWDGNMLNQYNSNSRKDVNNKSKGDDRRSGYEGCTFGLVNGLTSDGKIVYSNGVSAPKLFNEGPATGKVSYDDYSLKFIRQGDTYTLTAVNGVNLNDLEKFGHPQAGDKVYNHIWTNNFWPMDVAPVYNAGYLTNSGYHDVRFGGTATYKSDGSDERTNNAQPALGYGPNTDKANDKFLPESDDGQYHNSYFGMHYQVQFELTNEYVGPLEYYFFGDDDMWVFLSEISDDGKNFSNSKLVCDIGGVHSSVGEYVNLWDYLGGTPGGKEGKYALSFFYTERGASGSTCWMQFTLPSVTSLTPEIPDEDYGNLKIEKTVTKYQDGKEFEGFDNDDEFTFTVRFTDENGNRLPDDYSYVKYDKEGNELGHDLIIWDGGSFTLKNGEYIVVKFLPKGTRYQVIEASGAFTVTTGESSKIEYLTDITVDGKVPSVKPHTHSEACYTDKVLTCNKNVDIHAAVPHVHNNACYEDGKLVCRTEVDIVEHSKDCYKDGKLICGYVEAKDLQDDNMAASGIISDGKESQVKFTNKYYLYGLPETGGSGTNVYTIAGVIFLLGGAGLVYRKKFRERRV